MQLSEQASALYSHFLETLAIEDDALDGIVRNIALQRILDRANLKSQTASSSTETPLFTEPELLGLGMQPVTRLSPDTREKVLKAVSSVLKSIYLGIHGEAEISSMDVLRGLPDSIAGMKDDTDASRMSLHSQQQVITELVQAILEARNVLQQELDKGLSSTLPAHAAAQSSRVDLVGATIEASLVKLALGRARAEDTLYNQTLSADRTKNMAQALEISFKTSKAEEKDKKIELRRLDKVLKEYEGVLELVDCGHEGYQQVVDDWTKVQQDTEECLKDLRRLGWTGD